MKEKQTDRVMKGALVLTIAGIISKVLGASYRIPLQNLTGDIGFYMYQQIYPIIGIVLMMALYGFPSAISMMRAEFDLRRVRITFRNFFLPIGLIVLGICALFFIPLFTFGQQFAQMVGDMRLGGAYQAAAFVFLFVPFISLFRGYFQGNNVMKPTAYSQIGEQLVRVSIIIIGAYACWAGMLHIEKLGYVAVVAAIGGMITASMIGLSYIKKERLPLGEKERVQWKFYIRTILAFGVVASLNHMLLLLLQFVDMTTLIPHLQTYGLEQTQAMEAKGVFDRGQPLIQFGTVLGSSFALALLPAVKKKQENMAHSIQATYSFSIYIAVGATIGLFLLFPQVNELLFTDRAGTDSLRILVLSIVLSSMSITMIAILQGAGKMQETALAIVCICSIKWVLNTVLVPIWGISGSASATVLSLLFLWLFLLWRMRTLYPTFEKIQWKKWLGLARASSIMALYIICIQMLFSYWNEPSRSMLLLYVGFAVSSGAIIYMWGCIRWNVFTKEMIDVFPGSRFIKKMFNL